jgi:uncharacterized protein (DUF4415 family)
MKSKVKFGGKDTLPNGEFDPKKSKVKISLLLDGDLLEAYREAAKTTPHGEYQTLMKEKLREALFGKRIDSALRQTIRSIIREEMNKKVG